MKYIIWVHSDKRSWLPPRRALLFKSRLGPVVEKAKAAHTLSYIIQNQLAITRGILSHKGQPCPTNNDVMDHVTKYCNMVGLHCKTRLVYTIHQTVPSLVECLACEATVAQVFL